MSNNHQRVAVTGASGMLGRRVVAELLERGYEDIVLPMRNLARGEQLLGKLCRQGYDSTGRPLIQRVRIVETELNNPIELSAAIEGVHTLYHCAATISMDDSDPQQLIQSNVEITSHVVNAALAEGVATFVHVSSIAALGEATFPQTFIDEGCNLESMASTSPYGVSKFMCENQVMRGGMQGLRTIVVNPGVILGEGEGDWKSSPSAAIIPMVSSGLPFYTTGVVGYVDVIDVARAMVTLCEQTDCSGERYILVAANLSMRELIAMGAKVSGHRPPFIHIGAPLLSAAWRISAMLSKITGGRNRLSQSIARSMLRKSYYNGEKIKKVCNFEYTPLEQTIARIAGVYMEERNG